MGKFLLFVLMLILAAVFFVVVILANILGGFMRLIRGLFGGQVTKSASYDASTHQRQADETSADEKIFKEEDKEYVEFEEVDN